MKQPKGNSFTRLNQFASICERQYYLDCKSPRPPTPAMEKGSRLHGAVEGMAKHWLETGEWVAPVTDDGEIIDYVDRLLPLLRVLRPHEVELFFREIDGRWEPGKIDLISETTPFWDEEAEVFKAIDSPALVDYKFIGRRDKIKTEWEVKKSLQLQMYCLATDIQTAGFVFVLPTGRPILRFVEFSKTDLDKATRWLTMEGQVVAQRWAALGSDGEGFREVFSLASPDQPLCDPRWCNHWSACFGKDVL